MWFHRMVWPNCATNKCLIDFYIVSDLMFTLQWSRIAARTKVLKNAICKFWNFCGKFWHDLTNADVTACSSLQVAVRLLKKCKFLNLYKYVLVSDWLKLTNILSNQLNGERFLCDKYVITRGTPFLWCFRYVINFSLIALEIPHSPPFC